MANEEFSWQFYVIVLPFSILVFLCFMWYDPCGCFFMPLEEKLRLYGPPPEWERRWNKEQEKQAREDEMSYN